MCGVAIEVPLRTADAVLEVIPQGRVATPEAKISTSMPEGWGLVRVWRVGAGRKGYSPEFAKTRNVAMNKHSSNDNSRNNISGTYIPHIHTVIPSGDNHHQPPIHKRPHGGAECVRMRSSS